MGGKVYGFSDAWTKNELMIRQRDYEEPHYEGYEKRKRKKIESPSGNHMHVHEDAALGLDGSDFHMGGERVTNIKEEALPGGDVAVYWQNEHGGTYRQVWRKVDEGRHTPGERPRRIFTF